MLCPFSTLTYHPFLIYSRTLNEMTTNRKLNYDLIANLHLYIIFVITKDLKTYR